MSKNHWSTEFAQKKVQKGRESLRRSLFVALYTKYLQYSIGNHLIWNGLSKSQIQEYPVISQLWILWIATFNTQSERDNVELPLLPYHACSQVEQSQFESIAPIPVFEMFPFLRYGGKYSWQKNDPISIFHSIVAYFISTHIQSISYTWNTRTITPSHVWSKR